MAGCATPTRSAGHAPAGAKTDPKLTFNSDHQPGAGHCSPPTLTRHLARLRQLGVIKRVTGTYRYYLTRAGRAAIAAGRRLTEHTIIPALA